MWSSYRVQIQRELQLDVGNHSLGEESHRHTRQRYRCQNRKHGETVTRERGCGGGGGGGESSAVNEACFVPKNRAARLLGILLREYNTLRLVLLRRSNV